MTQKPRRPIAATLTCPLCQRRVIDLYVCAQRYACGRMCIFCRHAGYMSLILAGQYVPQSHLEADVEDINRETSNA